MLDRPEAPVFFTVLSSTISAASAASAASTTAVAARLRRAAHPKVSANQVGRDGLLAEQLHLDRIHPLAVDPRCRPHGPVLRAAAEAWLDPRKRHDGRDVVLVNHMPEGGDGVWGVHGGGRR